MAATAEETKEPTRTGRKRLAKDTSSSMFSELNEMANKFIEDEDALPD